MSDFPPNLSIRPLNIEDAVPCQQLEKKVFPENERASLEKIKYRLITCPELCSGLFIREYDPKYSAINLPDVAKRQKEESKDDGDDDGSDDELPVKSSVIKETLVGHILATKTPSLRVDLTSMEVPSLRNPNAGHIEGARNIAIHALAIDPDWQKKNLGTLLMHDYIQKLSNQDLGDKVILLAHKKLIPFYEKIGFLNLGESDTKFGNESWYDLVIELIPIDEV